MERDRRLETIAAFKRIVTTISQEYELKIPDFYEGDEKAIACTKCGKGCLIAAFTEDLSWIEYHFEIVPEKLDFLTSKITHEMNKQGFVGYTGHLTSFVFCWYTEEN